MVQFIEFSAPEFAAKDPRELQRLADEMCEACRETLRGTDIDARGLAVAQMAAMHIAGYPANFRDTLADLQGELIKDLIEMYAARLDPLRANYVTADPTKPKA